MADPGDRVRRNAYALGGFFLYVWYVGKALQFLGRFLCLPFARFDIPSIALVRESAARLVWRVSRFLALSVWPYGKASGPWDSSSSSAKTHDMHDGVDGSPSEARTLTFMRRDVRDLRLPLQNQPLVRSELSDGEARERDHDRFLSMLGSLEQSQREQAQEKDRSVVALSSALLAASILFIHYLVESPPQQAWSIYAAWCGLGVGMVTTTLSMHLASASYDVAIRDLERDYHEEEDMDDEPSDYRLSRWTGYLNAVSTIAFNVGVGALAIFAVANLVSRW